MDQLYINVISLYSQVYVLYHLLPPAVAKEVVDICVAQDYME